MSPWHTAPPRQGVTARSVVDSSAVSSSKVTFPNQSRNGEVPMRGWEVARTTRRVNRFRDHSREEHFNGNQEERALNCERNQIEA
jgi:hypothetical protein